MKDMTWDEAKSHNAVRRYVEKNGSQYLVVRPYGNSTLMNKLVDSNNMRLGNVAIEEVEPPNLRVNLTSIND